jgi:hypothetical protein
MSKYGPERLQARCWQRRCTHLPCVCTHPSQHTGAARPQIPRLAKQASIACTVLQRAVLLRFTQSSKYDVVYEAGDESGYVLAGIRTSRRRPLPGLGLAGLGVLHAAPAIRHPSGTPYHDTLRPE